MEELAGEASILNVQQIEFLPVTTWQWRDQTGQDPPLSKVLKYTQSGWHGVFSPNLKPFFKRKDEISIEAGCILWCIKVVIPEKYQPQVMKELHASHPGIAQMKGLARAHMWWPTMNIDIEATGKKCLSCQSIRNRLPLVVSHSWLWPTGPWERIHIDYAWPFLGTMFLVVVGAYSKWLEVLPMNNTMVEKTLDALQTMFAQYGQPKKLVSDKTPQFTANHFQEFMVVNRIEHLRSAPYHQASNGEIERFDQNFKNSLKAGQSDKGKLMPKLPQFLMKYRITPHMTTGVMPTSHF